MHGEGSSAAHDGATRTVALVALVALARLLGRHRDLLEARPSGREPPPPLVARGLAPFLAALGDDVVDRLEADPAAPWPTDTPAALSTLVQEARAWATLPPLSNAHAAAIEPRRHERPRKQAQVDAFAALIAPIAQRARRVVDVGSGHGHLTRALGAALGVPVVGVERDGSLVARARTLADGRATFDARDVLTEGLDVEDGDCVVGLHACGELGDAVVERVAAAGRGTSLALVGCCLQKRRADVRRALSHLAEGLDDDVAFPRSILGLSNTTARDVGVEASRAQNLRARERRLALRRLLEVRGVAVDAWGEIDGLNRRAAHAPLEALVARAFAARGLALPSSHDVEDAAVWARMAWASCRRWALPRNALARALEVFVAADRAHALEERGFTVSLGLAFDDATSARNIAILAVSS